MERIIYRLSFSAPSSPSEGGTQRERTIENHVLSLKQRLVEDLRKWFCEFIFEQLDAIHNCYIADHISSECELRLFETIKVLLLILRQDSWLTRCMIVEVEVHESASL